MIYTKLFFENFLKYSDKEFFYFSLLGILDAMFVHAVYKRYFYIRHDKVSKFVKDLFYPAVFIFYFVIYVNVVSLESRRYYSDFNTLFFGFVIVAFTLRYWYKKMSYFNDHKWIKTMVKTLIIASVVFFLIGIIEKYSSFSYLHKTQEPFIASCVEKEREYVSSIKENISVMSILKAVCTYIPVELCKIHMHISFFTDCLAISRFMYKTIHLYLSDLIFVLYGLGLATIIVLKIADWTMAFINGGGNRKEQIQENGEL